MKNESIKPTRRRILKLAMLSGVPIASSKTTRDIDAEVLIVGSGPAGLSIADTLGRQGVNVLLIESGGNRPSEQHQSLNDVSGSRLLVPSGLGDAGIRAVGGTTHVWGGISPRLQKSDFEGQRKYGYARDWPINFSELENYYCAAERWLRVSSGVCSNNAPSPFLDSSSQLRAALEGCGVSNNIAASMSVDKQGLFRPINLARSMVQRFVAQRRSRLLRNTVVRRVVMNSDGAARGVECRTASGAMLFVRAQTVVLACGAIQNARLLLLSEQTGHNDGLGNQGGYVGRGLMDHPNLQVWVAPSHPYIAPQHLCSYVHSYQYYLEMKRQGLGSTLLRIGSYSPDWQARSRLRRLPESRGMMPSGHTLMIEALCEQEPSESNRLTLSSTLTDRNGDSLAHLSFSQTPRDLKTIAEAKDKIFELADGLGNDPRFRPLELSSHHLMGTTRMGFSDQDGVVDRNQLVFGTRNVYMAGGSVFPSGGAANPTLSLTALSLRLAAYLSTLR